MPAGVDNPELGGIAFAAIKLAGYCTAAFVISKLYGKAIKWWFPKRLARTLIGIAFGYPYFNWATSSFQSLAFMFGLIPIRMIEWLLLVIIFYDRKLGNRRKAYGVAAAGTAWSFLLDLPATIGYILVGGF